MRRRRREHRHSDLDIIEIYQEHTLARVCADLPAWAVAPGTVETRHVEMHGKFRCGRCGEIFLGTAGSLLTTFHRREETIP